VKRYALTLEWDGRPFMGWQRQAHGPSVQQALEEAAQKFCHHDVTALAAGRTDAGVHARAMRVHIDLDTKLNVFRIGEALNALLRPHPIAVLDVVQVADDWHARFACVGRAYDYVIVNRRAPLTYEMGLVWQIPARLDADAMHEAAQTLVGLHDFTTFRSAHCQAESPIKTLDRLDVRRSQEKIIIRAEARSFLHHQVRSMVGCLALVGRGHWSNTDLADALAAKDRDALGHNAPPDGLYFAEARYPG
jgi:tRNA pseudouridine38-40 synthase